MKVLNVLSIIDTQWRGREGGRRKGEGEEEREKEKKKGGEMRGTSVLISSIKLGSILARDYKH